MKSRWVDDDALRAIDRWASEHGERLALRTYSARLLGAEPGLVRHGGGNTSVKDVARDAGGAEIETLWIKPSGRSLADLEPGDQVGLDLERLRRPLVEEPRMPVPDGPPDDRALEVFLRSRMLDPTGPAPSLETPVHAVVPGRFVDHAHPDDVLALSHRPNGRELLEEIAGDDVAVLSYVSPGLALAAACREALAGQPGLRGMIWELHGAITWADEARESYEAMIDLVGRARELRDSLARRGPRIAVGPVESLSDDERRDSLLAIRRLVSLSSAADPAPVGAADAPVILRHRSSSRLLALLAGTHAAEALSGTPLTADHVVRTGPWPVWLDPARRDAWREDVTSWSERYRRLTAGDDREELPRTALVPGLGVVAAGPTAREADVALDLLFPALEVQQEITESGDPYVSLPDEHLAEMDRRPAQRAKRSRAAGPLHGRVALVTGAAGAIGSGISGTLVDAGAHVALADLPGDPLDRLLAQLEGRAPGRVLPLPFDVTDPAATAEAFHALVDAWGGLDLFVPNAGLAWVADLQSLRDEDFRRLEAVNVEGTLHGLREASRLFRAQELGGDVVLVSTKNVFSPGASFGAYSATKAAAHQLARVAALELAPSGVRVNMVAPDAVFGEEDRPSGLWEEVGPSRMAARGLDADELREYYRTRNLLRARIVPSHVGEAVLFFATRRTPTTGATLPVDGGLPDATPR